MKRRLLRVGVGVYLVATVVSCVVRSEQPGRLPGPGDRVVTVAEVRGDQTTGAPVRIAYSDRGPTRPSAPVLVLLHGSPGRKDDFEALVSLLDANARVIVPDLPGFGASSLDLPDYSFRAHAHYVRQLLDAIEVPHVHVVGFSMGGGVALNLIDLAPSRVASLTMLSAIGIQEAELTGDYSVNHLVHGAQLALLWGLREGTPHMGLLDGSLLGVGYARNFFDSDQRPLRHVLTRVQVPTLIVHGPDDVLVPVEAAREHARLVPQSRLVTMPGSHFLLFGDTERVAETIGSFVQDVERGTAPTRANADPERVRVAARDARLQLPRLRGMAAVVTQVVFVVLAALSETVAVAAAGAMVARGRIGVFEVLRACVIGAGVAHVALFWIARRRGARWFNTSAGRWCCPPGLVAMASRALRLSVPNAIADATRRHRRRLLTVAAGLTKVSAAPFVIGATGATVLWTALGIAGAALTGVALRLLVLALDPRTHTTLVIAAGVVAVFAVRAGHRKERRLLLSSWRRVTRWEFWPPWVFYPPLFVHLLRLAWKHGGATVFTAANPAMPAGGVIGESKFAILQGLAGAAQYVARSALIPAHLSLDEKVGLADDFMRAHDLRYPVVLKPDQGQRGSGVLIVRSSAELAERLAHCTLDTILQEFIAGPEFGVFYYRHPGATHGHLFSVTEKRFTAVVGDGRRTLEQLILDDDRAVCAARLHLERHAPRLADVPSAGAEVPLVELGTHCRGATFLDGRWAVAPGLETRIDAIARAFDGFYFGRFDIRAAAGVQAFGAGEGFKIIELNGVTSEATHIYQPGTPLRQAYRVLREQWRLAFEIGAENRRRGVAVTSVRGLVRLALDYRARAGRLKPAPTI